MFGAADLGARLNTMPTANISAITSGVDGEGPAVVAAEATARVDFGLVPAQDPDDVLAKLRRHLVKGGFSDVKIEAGQALWPARGSLDSPLAAAALSAASVVYGEPIVSPLLPGAGPGRVFLDRLGARIVTTAGTTRMTSGIHGVDEHGAVADYLDHIRFTVRLLETLAVDTRFNS